MARGIQISDAARALAEIRFIVGMNSSFFTWQFNRMGLNRWGSEELRRAIFPLCCNLKNLESTGPDRLKRGGYDIEI